MKKFKRIIALFLAVCMIASTPLSALAAQPAAAQSEETFSKVLHLDNGRKYFSKDWIIALVNEMEAAGYNQLQLAFGNDGMRFLLDDMSVTANGTTYSSDIVTAGIKAGNKAYYDAGEVNELTQAEMTEIVNYAKSKGIEVVPHMNMPGHMDAILDAIEYAGISNAHFTGNTTSVRSLNLNNTEAVNFTLALLEKYVAYFDDLGCQYFHIGADEFGNDAYGSSMGFPSMGENLYAKFAEFVNDAAEIVKDAGMTPRAWNDGISYGYYTEDFDDDIQITYWSSGWGGYDVASASKLRNNGHAMINTNGDYYFILANSGITNPSSSALNFDNNTFMGSTISDPVGSMFCIWCDDPGSATEQETAEAVRITLRKMAAAMNNTTTYSEEVVPGGFNEDGSINDSRAWNEVTPESNSAIQVSGYDITSVEATEVAVTELPSIGTAEKTKAWDITPYVGTEKYTGTGTVSLPVPAEWDTSKVKGFYVEDGKVVFVKGTYTDGKYTFDMPHFSVAGIAETGYDELIELEVGKSETVTVEGVDLTGNTYTPDPAGVASVSTAKNTTPTKKLKKVTSAAGIVSGGQYIFVNTRSGNVLGDTTGYTSTWKTTCLVQDSEEKSVDSPAWTITQSGSNYQLANDNGKYMTIGNNSANLSNSAVNLTIYDYGNETFAIGQNGYYLNDMGGAGQFAGGYNVLSDPGAPWEVYRVVESTGVAGTDVTFTGDSAGTAFVTINDVVYKIVVHGTVDITINYKTANGTVIKTETVTVADNATTYKVSSFNYNDKYYAVNDPVLNIYPSTEISYDVLVTETTENLSAVTPLTINYWITNQKVPIEGETTQSLSAVSVHSESGVNFAELVPASDSEENPKVLWRGWLLPDGYHQEGENTSPDMCTDEHGSVIQKIRYWSGEWEYFNGDSWESIASSDQINAYYIQQTEITKEVTTNVTDWGETYKDWSALGGNYHWFWNQYVETGSKYVFLDFAVVYEDGTQTPNAFPVDDTWFFHFENCSETNPRVLKPITFTETSEYEIWKVTVTDGTSDGYSSASTFTSSYDATSETVVWDESMGGVPHIESLAYTANRSGKLIRIYVRAVKTEDTLKVVYYDESFGDTLYSYNISVESGKTFNNGIVGSKVFTGDTGRMDVSSAYIVNALNKEQRFQTDLTLVPEAVGKYNSKLYEYNGSEIIDNGKTLRLYYTVNTEVLSPMFISDYARPFTFTLDRVVNDVTLVKTVDVNQKTRYGTFAYNATDKVFTYTPTQVLQGVDVLTMNIEFTTGQTLTTNSGVLPASTMNYDEGFAIFNGFTGGTKGNALPMQEAGKSTDVYGYDANVAGETNAYAVSTTRGDTAEFTFTGRGVDLYVNSKEKSGNIAVQVRDANDDIVKLYSVKTTSNSTITDEFSNTNQNGLIAVSLMGLEYGQYTVIITTTAPNADGVYFDGFRVYGTVENNANQYYVADGEANPTFIELRDEVLAGVRVDTSGSEYVQEGGTIYQQVYNASTLLNGALYLKKNETDDNDGAITVEQASALLDNGPKNELFLLPGDVVTFNLGTTTAQIGMKAISAAASYELIYDVDRDFDTTVDQTKKTGTISTNTDMFYEEGVTSAVTIKNTGETILSITQLKIFGVASQAEDFTFEPISEEQITFALRSMAGLLAEAPGTPDTPVDPQPGTPTPEPGTPDPEPGKPDPKPEHKCKMKEEIKPATTTKNGKIVIKCKECGEVESTKVIYKASNVKLSKNEFVYNGKVKSPKLTIKDSKGNTIAKKYYSVSKPAGRKNVGKYTYTIKFKGLYEGTKKLTLTVKPKATSVKKVTASKKAFTVKWNKVSKQATGYEIMYATNAKFSKGKHTVKVTKLNTTSKKISKLKAKQKYYVKVRTYKTVKVNGKKTNIYSAWSSPKTITVKK